MPHRFESATETAANYDPFSEKQRQSNATSLRETWSTLKTLRRTVRKTALLASQELKKERARLIRWDQTTVTLSAANEATTPCTGQSQGGAGATLTGVVMSCVTIVWRMRG